MNGSMRDKSLVVVGASSGIGRAIATHASRDGATLHLVGRDAARLKRVGDALAGPWYAHAADALDEAAVARAFADIGAFDFLTHTAVADETALTSPVRDMPTATARRGMEKFWTTFNVCRAAACTVRPAGAMVLTSSVGAVKPSRSGASVMNAASAAVTAFARALALELAPVRVNIAAPGVVGTGVWSDAEREGLERWASDTLPAGRLGTAEDLALAYLAALANPYMTGDVITVDGGLSLL